VKSDGTWGISVLDRYRHAYLLFSLFLLLTVRPFLGDELLGIALFDLLFFLTMGTSVLACARTRRHAIIGLILAIAVVFERWELLLSGEGMLMKVLPWLGLIFFAYVTVLVLRDVFVGTTRVSADTICGAISAYLLMGLAWTFAYAALEVAEPNSFSFSGLQSGQGFERFMGFSFVTLTTLGYGNIVPMNPRADALTTTEAMVGQIYLTVLVARLVAMHVSNGGLGRDKGNKAKGDS